MNMGTSTDFAEQEAAAMEKNREAFMALFLHLADMTATYWWES